MPAIIDSVKINEDAKHKELDRRRKLTDEDRLSIRHQYFDVHESERPTMTALAVKYKVDRRLIQFILFPEREERHKRQASIRQKEGRYYDREKSRIKMQEYRNYKRELVKQGKLSISEPKNTESQRSEQSL